MRRAAPSLLLLLACDDASFIVRVHRPELDDRVTVRACGACIAVDPFEGAAAALDRSVGFFVHTVPQTLTLEWTVADRCDQFDVAFAGERSIFDVSVSPRRAPQISGCTSCGGPRPCGADAGTGGGAGGGGGSTGGGSAGGGSAGGGSAGGGSAGGAAGGGFSGDGGPFTWTPMTLADHPHIVTGIGALSAVAAWAVVTDNTTPQNNLILTLDAGTGVWVPVYGVSTSDPFSDLAVAKVLPRVAAVHHDEVVECDRGATLCSRSADWTSYPLAASGDSLEKVCTDGQRFFVTGTTTTTEGGLYARSGGWYQRLVSFSPAGIQLRGCDVRPDQSVVAAGFGAVAVYFPDAGSAVYPITGSGLSFTQWNAVRQVGAHTFIAGGSKVVELLPDAGFKVWLNPGGTGGPNWKAMASGSFNEALAAGDDAQAALGAAVFDGTHWNLASSVYPRLDVLTAAAADPNTYFFGGLLRNSSGGVIGGLIVSGRR